MPPDDRVEAGLGPWRSFVLDEIQGLRRLMILAVSIIVALQLVSLTLNALRVYVVEQRLIPLQKQVEQLKKEKAK